MSRLRISEVRPMLPRKFVAVHQRRRLIEAIVELAVESGAIGKEAHPVDLAGA